MKYILLLALILTSCGGGTSGTSSTGGSGVGIQRVFSGRVISESGEAISGALIEIDNGDASATSDESGRFAFSSSFDEASNLKVRKESISSTVKLPMLSDKASIVNLDIREFSKMFVINNLELSLESIGGPACEGKFGPVEVISFARDAVPLLIADQIVKTEDRVSCFATVLIKSNGKVNSGIGAEMYFKSIEYNPDPDTDPTKLISKQETNIDGRIIFEFKPSDKKRGAGYFVIETPSNVPFNNRVAVVINPFL
jgi:hypothetical protein